MITLTTIPLIALNIYIITGAFTALYALLFTEHDKNFAFSVLIFVVMLFFWGYYTWEEVEK